jgi:anti-anti-sigma factor
MADLASIRVDKLDDVVVVHLAGEIDLSNSYRIGLEMPAVWASGLPVVVDCTDLAYVDSSGVRLLESAAIAAVSVGVPFRLTLPRTSTVRPMLMITGLAMRCPVDTDVNASVRNARPIGETL